MQKLGSIKYTLRRITGQKGGRPDSVTGNGGFTLMEIMVALMILAIGVMGIWSMQGVAIRSNTTARRITDTATLGADQFEVLMRLPYNSAALTPETTTTQTITRNNIEYTLSWTVSALNVPINNVKTITVNASWMEAGQQRSVAYVYYKAKRI